MYASKKSQLTAIDTRLRGYDRALVLASDVPSSLEGLLPSMILRR